MLDEAKVGNAKKSLETLLPGISVVADSAVKTQFPAPRRNMLKEALNCAISQEQKK